MVCLLHPESTKIFLVTYQFAVKAYIRKSHVLFGMREFNKSMDAIQLAAEHDDDHKSTSEIQQQMIKIQQAVTSERAGETDEQAFARAMKDPEVAEM
jgi:stress-induced-phosphoprotein 1